MKPYQAFTFTMLLGCILLFAQCSARESMVEGNHEDASQEMSSDYTEGLRDQSVPDIQDRTFQTLVTVYLDLREALVASDAEAAKSIASRLLTTLANLDPEDSLEAVKDEVKNILDSEDIKQQRVHFAPLSQQFYQLVKTNQGQQITLYKQHCPMALDGKGAFWISDSKEIENPYYGAQMLNCGTVKETLAVNN
ncbi:MAG: DUF3347 domain-containing protein [Cyclobacteriaceae bacterium]